MKLILDRTSVYDFASWLCGVSGTANYYFLDVRLWLDFVNRFMKEGGGIPIDSVEYYSCFKGIIVTTNVSDGHGLFSRDYLEDIHAWEIKRQAKGEQIKMTLKLWELNPQIVSFNQAGNVEGHESGYDWEHNLFCSDVEFLLPKFDDQGKLIRLTKGERYIIPSFTSKIEFEVERSGSGLLVEPIGAENPDMNNIWLILGELPKEWPSTKETINKCWDENCEPLYSKKADEGHADQELENFREAKRLGVHIKVFKRWKEMSSMIGILPRYEIADRVKMSEDTVKRDLKLMKEKKYP